MTTAEVDVEGRSKDKTNKGLPQHEDFHKNDDGRNHDEESKDNKRKFGYFELFRYATTGEKCGVCVGVLLGALASSMIPYIIVIYGEFASLLVDRSVAVGTSSPTMILNIFGGGAILTNASHEENMLALKDDSLAYLLASISGAIIQLILLASAVDILNRIALKQIGCIRKKFLEAVLRQDMSWYDTASDNNFAGKMTEDLEKMKEGMGEKIVIFAFLIATFLIAIVVAFVYGWKLTLVTLVCCPFIIISTALVARIQSNCTEKELASYSAAGSVAEEVFQGIRTVAAFSGEPKEAKRFSNLLEPSEKVGIQKGLYSGIGSGMMWLIMYCCIALAMWYGVKLILADRMEEDRAYTPAVLIIILFGIIMGAQNLGFSTPHIEAFSTARGAAQGVFSIIDRQSAIDPMDHRGIKPNDMVGNISLQKLHFHYPSRPDVKVLQGLSLEVQAGQTVAFVGSSGCGKSTVLQLMQRFYDPLSGAVLIDGKDIRDYNVGWLRSQIGVVGQEPILFATTIEENIRYGHPSATQSDIERAARMANCHDFIMKFPKTYKTMVGERGAQMSGGQKQRIAIARALIRNPKILLLDEATSALDPTSERTVQKALDLASKGRTTLVVSHRLSTVTNADLIVFVRDGVIVEQGTHSQLMSQNGPYSHLVNINKRKEEQEKKITQLSPNNLRKRNVPTKEEEKYSDEKDEPIRGVEEIENNTTIAKSEGQEIVNKEEEDENYNITFKQLMRLNSPEWAYIVVGCIAAAMQGASYPIWAIFFGDFFGALADENNDNVQSRANTFALIFIGIGVFTGISTFLQTHLFNAAGVKMTTRLRNTAFKTIINQEIGYFDEEKNSIGALCARLATDCSSVQGATGARIGIIIQTIATLSIGIIIAFIYSWNLALVTLVTVPLVCFCILFEARYMESSIKVEKAATEDASQVAVEAVSNIRTVSSLCLEANVLERYGKKIDDVSVACMKKLRYRGVIYALGQSAPFLAYGISLYYGGILVANDELPFEEIIKVSEALIFGSMMLGQTLAYAPNLSGAVLSAGRLMKLFERQPKIYSPPEKPFTTAQKIEGDITYENIDFHYPTRTDLNILQNLNLDVATGNTVALVGPSGCGKSTCVQLLLRYYDPVKGSVNLNGVPTTDFNIDTLRSKMGLVSQEPVLFDRTIAENICYGNNARSDIPMVEIIEAAKKANIHDFITNLPEGYDTPLGSKGAQLSGGQKQRIAIARALIRNPKILLLDEATSALDMESEKVVQNALDAARSGRTCITIAHRLTTIRDADVIFVLQNGAVAESGTHNQLMAKQGIYAELYTMQEVS